MFAEHVDAKETAVVDQAKDQALWSERRNVPRPDYFQNAQQVTQKNLVRPKHRSGGKEAVKLVPVVQSGLSRINLVAVKVFHLDSGVVEEKTTPLENFSTPVLERPFFRRFLAWLGKGIAFWF